MDDSEMRCRWQRYHMVGSVIKSIGSPAFASNLMQQAGTSSSESAKRPSHSLPLLRAQSVQNSSSVAGVRSESCNTHQRIAQVPRRQKYMVYALAASLCFVLVWSTGIKERVETGEETATGEFADISSASFRYPAELYSTVPPSESSQVNSSSSQTHPLPAPSEIWNVDAYVMGHAQNVSAENRTLNPLFRVVSHMPRKQSQQ